MAIIFESVILILRIFDIGKADEFYQGLLGFTVDWDHRGTGRRSALVNHTPRTRLSKANKFFTVKEKPG